MAFDFPANPTLGQVWGGPNGADYKWDGVKWTGAMNEAGAYLSLLGGTTSGPISVPAGAAGSQVPQAQEVVARESIIGAVMDFYLSSPPENWLGLYGSEASRTHLRADYPELWDLIRNMSGVGSGNGSTTFVLPNLGTRFRRTATSGGGVGAMQADEIRSHNHGSGGLGGSTSFTGSHSHAVNDAWFNQLSGSTRNLENTAGEVVAGGSTAPAGNHSHGLNISGSTAPTGGSETRPINVAVLTCIRAR